MIVYTVQPEFLYKKMRQQGYLEGSKEHASYPEAYEWMVSQMMKRIDHKNKDSYPIWLWKRVPNRNEKALATKGTRAVVLKLDIPENEILWSSFDEWHSILNESPIVYDEKEWQEFEEKGFPTEEVRNTWELLFDNKWLSSRPKGWATDTPNEWMQGVTSTIKMHHIKKVTRFIAK